MLERRTEGREEAVVGLVVRAEERGRHQLEGDHSFLVLPVFPVLLPACLAFPAFLAFLLAFLGQLRHRLQERKNVMMVASTVVAASSCHSDPQACFRTASLVPCVVVVAESVVRSAAAAAAAAACLCSFGAAPLFFQRRHCVVLSSFFCVVVVLIARPWSYFLLASASR